MNGLFGNQSSELSPLGLLYAYRSNPFSLATDMSRPAQFLPQGLPSFDYAAQARAQQLAAQQAAAVQRSAAMSGWDYSGGPGVGSDGNDGGAAAAAGDAAAGDGGGGGGGGK